MMKRPAFVALLLAGVLGVSFALAGQSTAKRSSRRSSAGISPAGKAAATKPGATRVAQKAAGKAAKSSKSKARPTKVAAALTDTAPQPEIFRGWTKPKITLVFSGDINGYIEPCGCTGRETQKGGLQRRHSLLKKLAADGWNPVAFDVGGFISRSGRQGELKLETALKSLKAMGYEAMTFGKVDWSFDVGVKYTIISDVNAPDDAGDKKAFMAANVALFDPDVSPRFRTLEAAGYKIGVTAILGNSFHQAVAATVDADLLKFTNAAEALESVVPELGAAACDIKILLAHASPDESRALAAKFPQFQFVVSASGGADEPPLELEVLKGKKTRLVEVGKKGMYVIVIGLYDDPKQPIRSQVVPLDARWEDSPEMLALMTEYQEKLQSEGWEGLQLVSEAHSQAKEMGDFVGSDACSDCHPSAYETWKNSGHARATDALAELTPPRQYDPECISCHATGWKPQAFTPLKGGYDGMATTPHLMGNGCENCHGPGGAHVAAENGGDAALQGKLRAALHLDKTTAKTNLCIKCHDGDNDPFFGHPDEEGNDTFETKYWAPIAHPNGN